MYCKNCRKPLNQGEKFCSNCGTKIENVNQQTFNQTFADNQTQMNKMYQQEQHPSQQPQKTKKNKLIWILAIIVGIVVIISFNSKKANINDVAIKRMEKKYSEKCEYLSPFGKSYTGTREFMVKCESYPNQEILVRIENYKKAKERVFLDNYLAVKYKYDTLDLIKELARKTYSDANVFYKVSTQALSPELSAGTSFKDYLSDSTAEIHPIIEVKASSYDSAEKIKELADSIMRHSGCYYVSVVFVDDSEYGLSDFETMKNRMGTGDFVHCAKITGDLNKYEVRWLNEK